MADDWMGLGQESGVPMKTYLMTTGTLFGLLTGVHIWRIIKESQSLAPDPWFLVITAASAALCLWALRLLRVGSRSQ